MAYGLFWASTKSPPTEKMKFHFFGLQIFLFASLTAGKSDRNENPLSKHSFFADFLLAAYTPPLRIKTPPFGRKK